MAKKVKVNTDVRIVQSLPGFVAEKGISFKTVKSSNIRGYFYDSKKKDLYILFNNRRVYVYAGVSRYVLNSLKEAPSKGRYFNASIRHKYSYAEL